MAAFRPEPIGKRRSIAKLSAVKPSLSSRQPTGLNPSGALPSLLRHGVGICRELIDDERSAQPVVGDGEQADSDAATQPLSTNQQYRPGFSPGAHPIIIDANIEPGKSIKSIEVNCKIEYS